MSTLKRLYFYQISSPSRVAFFISQMLMINDHSLDPWHRTVPKASNFPNSKLHQREFAAVKSTMLILTSEVPFSCFWTSWDRIVLSLTHILHRKRYCGEERQKIISDLGSTWEWVGSLDLMFLPPWLLLIRPPLGLFWALSLEISLIWKGYLISKGISQRNIAPILRSWTNTILNRLNTI